ILYLLALSAKSTACTLPAALLLILWLQKKPIKQPRLTQIAPFVIMGIGMGLLAVWWERYHQGTSRAIFTFLSPVERVLVASRAVWFYLGKLIWPGNLTFIYPKWQILSTHLPDYMWLLVGIGLCVAIYFLRRYTGRSVEVAAAFFVATLSPVLGFMMLFTFRYTFVADHYQYLACIGPIALASAGIVSLADALKQQRAFICSAALFAVAMLAILTWWQSSMFGDVETLWRTTLARNPECWMADTNLGIVLLEKGQLDTAIQHFRAAVLIRPEHADCLTFLAVALDEKGETAEAIQHYKKALEISPESIPALTNLGWLIATCSNGSLRNGAKAVEIARRADELSGGSNPIVLRTLAAAYAEAGQFGQAIETASVAIQLSRTSGDHSLSSALEEQ